MPHADNDGTRIHYEVTGSGPPVLLQHGAAMSIETWRQLGYLDAFTDSFRVIAVDARGHGHSDKPRDPDDYALAAMVDDITTVLDATGVDRVHYLGYAMGAQLGWGVAQLAPDRLRSLMIGAADPHASRGSAGATIDLLREGVDTLVDAFREMWEIPEWMGQQFLANDPAALLAYFRGDWPDLGTVADNLAVPTLIFVGENDAAHDGCRRAAEEVADAEFFSLPGLDHISTMARTDLVVPIVRDFVRRVERSAA